MKYFLAPLAFLAAMVPAYAAAPAATQQTTQASVSVTGWRLECDPGKTTLACHALDQIVSNTNGAQVLGFNVTPAPDGKTVFAISVPLGSSLRTPIGVSVVGGPSQSFTFLACSQQSCVATGVVNADLLAAMRAGKGELRVNYGLLDNGLVEHEVTASLPLTGFGEVYDRLK